MFRRRSMCPPSHTLATTATHLTIISALSLLRLCPSQRISTTQSTCGPMSIASLKEVLVLPSAPKPTSMLRHKECTFRSCPTRKAAMEVLSLTALSSTCTPLCSIWAPNAPRRNSSRMWFCTWTQPPQWMCLKWWASLWVGCMSTPTFSSSLTRPTMLVQCTPQDILTAFWITVSHNLARTHSSCTPVRSTDTDQVTKFTLTISTEDSFKKICLSQSDG